MTFQAKVFLAACTLQAIAIGGLIAELEYLSGQTTVLAGLARVERVNSDGWRDTALQCTGRELQDDSFSPAEPDKKRGT